VSIGKFVPRSPLENQLMMSVWILALLIGVICGLRSMTAPAVVCWGAHLGWLALAGSTVGFLARPVFLVVFTLFAIGELIADKLPFIPRRTMIGPLAVRIVFGAICGAALAIAGHGVLSVGGVLCAVGGVLGAYAGYAYRRAASSSGRIPDLPAALLEDLVAVGGGLFLVSRF
jgi:uncharacterized membrane protein